MLQNALHSNAGCCQGAASNQKIINCESVTRPPVVLAHATQEMLQYIKGFCWEIVGKLLVSQGSNLGETKLGVISRGRHQILAFPQVSPLENGGDLHGGPVCH